MSATSLFQRVGGDCITWSEHFTASQLVQLAASFAVSGVRAPRLYEAMAPAAVAILEEEDLSHGEVAQSKMIDSRHFNANFTPMHAIQPCFNTISTPMKAILTLTNPI